MKPEDIKKAKDLLAQMRMGKDVKIGAPEKKLLDEYHLWRMEQPFSKKRLGKSVDFETVVKPMLGSLVMTNRYAVKLNDAVKAYMVRRLETDVEYASTNKKPLTFRALEIAERAEAKVEKEKSKAENKAAREARKAEKEQAKAERAKNRAARLAAKKAKVLEDAKKLGIVK